MTSDIHATFLPMLTNFSSDGFLDANFLYTSMVNIVLMLFVIDANEETMAATRAANVSPSKPLGNKDIIIG